MGDMMLGGKNIKSITYATKYNIINSMQTTKNVLGKVAFHLNKIYYKWNENKERNSCSMFISRDT